MSVLFLADTMATFLLQSIQKSSGAHPASYAIGTVSSFQGAAQLRHEAKHSPPPYEREELYIHICIYLHGLHRNNFTLTFYLRETGCWGVNFPHMVYLLVLYDSQNKQL